MGRSLNESGYAVEEYEESVVEKRVVDELNKKHAVIRINKFYILTEDIDTLGNPTFSLEGRSSFRAYYEDEVVKLPSGRFSPVSHIWLRSPRRRKYSGIVFDPSSSPDPTKYNLWKGFACEPRKGNSEKFWNHVKENICAKNEKNYEFVRKWLATIFQHPQEIHTSIVLCGSQGVGKNVFVEAIGTLLGPHYTVVSGLKELLASFNFHLKNAVLVHANEAVWGHTKHHLGTLKAMITDRLCLIEGKGKDRIMLRNYKHVIISSNETFPVHLDSDDRRFFVLRVGDAQKENYQYFKQIIKELENGGYEALLYDLLHEDISSFNPRVFPWSKESFNIKLLSSHSCARYLYEALSMGHFDIGLRHPWRGIVQRADMYRYYKEWCITNGEVSMQGNTFGSYLKKIFPTTKSTRLSVDGARIYAHVLPLLAHAREDFCTAFKGDKEELF